MKQKDIFLIVVVVIISVIVATVVSKQIIANPKNRQQKVEVVQAIQPDFQTPDKKYFNSNSIDPTQLIRIGDNSNKKPF
jgi:hypothetical protein